MSGICWEQAACPSAIFLKKSLLLGRTRQPTAKSPGRIGSRPGGQPPPPQPPFGRPRDLEALAPRWREAAERERAGAPRACRTASSSHPLWGGGGQRGKPASHIFFAVLPEFRPTAGRPGDRRSDRTIAGPENADWVATLPLIFRVLCCRVSWQRTRLGRGRPIGEEPEFALAAQLGRSPAQAGRNRAGPPTAFTRRSRRRRPPRRLASSTFFTKKT